MDNLWMVPPILPSWRSSDLWWSLSMEDKHLQQRAKLMMLMCGSFPPIPTCFWPRLWVMIIMIIMIIMTSKKSRRRVKVLRLCSGWWFGTLFFPYNYWECHHPNWLAYFSDGLKPPTSFALVVTTCRVPGVMRPTKRTSEVLMFAVSCQAVFLFEDLCGMKVMESALKHSQSISINNYL